VLAGHGDIRPGFLFDGNQAFGCKLSHSRRETRFPQCVLDGEHNRPARAADADQLGQPFDADVTGREYACRNDAGEMSISEGQRSAERKAMQRCVDDLLGSLGEHAFRNIERLHVRVADDAQPFADEPGAGTGIKQEVRSRVPDAARASARQIVGCR